MQKKYEKQKVIKALFNLKVSCLDQIMNVITKKGFKFSFYLILIFYTQ